MAPSAGRKGSAGSGLASLPRENPDEGKVPELVVEEDHARVGLVALGNLVLTLILFFTAFIAADFGQQGLIWAFLVTVAALTTAWFTVKNLARYGLKFVRGTPVAEFMSHVLVVHEAARTDVVVPYGKITSARIVHEGRALRLLLGGDWVRHPSGLYYVGIVYPFQPERLGCVASDVAETLGRHHVRVEVPEKSR